MHRKNIGKIRREKKRAAAPRSTRTVTPVDRMPRSGGKLRLSIATQPTLPRDVLSRLLGQVPGLKVVGQGYDEDTITKMLKSTSPDLLLFDYEAFGPNSESIISRLRRMAPRTRVLVMAMRSADENVERALRAGASGLVGKQLDFETLLQAVRAVAGGQVWANRRAQALTLEHLTDFSAGAAEPEGQLTKREQQVAGDVARGLRNKEIARHLTISEKTVKSHLNNIFHKLGIEGRFALAVFDQNHTQPRT